MITAVSQAETNIDDRDAIVIAHPKQAGLDRGKGLRPGVCQRLSVLEFKKGSTIEMGESNYLSTII